MFRRKPPVIESLLGASTFFHGDLEFEGGLRLEGCLKGSLNASTQPSMLIITEQARVEGEVRGDHIIISGTVTGPVHANSTLELLPQARIIGDISYATLKIHSGAEVTGKLHVLRESQAPTFLPAPSHHEE
jgi:cytoskeletal protein CcmA (bactofilin family)